MGKSKYGNNGSRQWVHPQESLLRRYIVYNVKFLGKVEVERSKGMDIIKDAIHKMKFSKQIMKSEGHKISKVELTISIDGVSLQEPKTKVIKYRYPLHRISYCADDKADKRMFTFIAKDSDDNKHYCFVFDSEKCAEEITLTIGQAFDLAYRRYNNGSGQNVLSKQCDMLKKKVNVLDTENTQLKDRITELETLIGSDVILKHDAHKTEIEPVVNSKLEELHLESPTSADTPNGSGDHSKLIQIPRPVVPMRNKLSQSPEYQGAAPALPPRPRTSSDAFGMEKFNPTDLVDGDAPGSPELMDLQDDFCRGISFDDFTLEELDPLYNKGTCIDI